MKSSRRFFLKQGGIALASISIAGATPSFLQRVVAGAEQLKAGAPGRRKTLPFSGWVYRWRNRVESFFGKIKHFRAIATRYDKRDDNFLAGIKLAAVRIWLRSYESVT